MKPINIERSDITNNTRTKTSNRKWKVPNNRQEFFMGCDDKSIHRKSNTKFLGIIMDSTLQWKAHTDSLLTKLNTACYALRTLKQMMRQVCYGLFFF
jgi:hypothetical protein